jgi:hypothetical protein
MKNLHWDLVQNSERLDSKEDSCWPNSELLLLNYASLSKHNNVEYEIVILFITGVEPALLL